MTPLSRRALLQFSSALLPLHLLDRWTAASMSAVDAEPSAVLVRDGFPRHAPEIVHEVVLVAHFDEKRVRELVDVRPALARAAVDWGFGDWETALGAASHMGNRPIAEYLISKGARPSLFSAAMLGQLEVVKAFLAAQPGAQRIRGPHSISLLAHAKAGGSAARPVFEFLTTVEGAGEDPEVPLSTADRELIAGSYVFGRMPADQIDLTLDRNRALDIEQFTWTRKGTFGRPLFHLGNRVFYPAGARDARIRFTEAANEVVMTVHDPDLALTAHKKVVK